MESQIVSIVPLRLATTDAESNLVEKAATSTKLSSRASMVSLVMMIQRKTNSEINSITLLLIILEKAKEILTNLEVTAKKTKRKRQKRRRSPRKRNQKTKRENGSGKKRRWS